ncbi:3-hydroxyacyl-CoA dehydrogenase/enoyl-CoA hydratase family protein [Granulosicoccus antarcticus]|uniref:Putative 3-hydroxyacyl-CoA dehydrogenase n=1 Tax=Granulosicoccus antarcticus IMCC3135 TaxID=1192854 RepID=A0A2Z2NJP3_9GAMM|nr:3-hydroxyacyl-CoA dehydrogenase/enoyl-CoA hydratase family protein [Granulosicoccus antarcticus]ASJ71526.1 putative 3-hydroxyacyl-CoA dehydrogenase [Granulosicoccus antarcticus IMCC3135]
MFKQIAVIGSGTMGAGIAGQIANAGHRVLLLDLPGEDEANAISSAALARLIKSEPPALMHADAAQLITVGNIRDDFDKLATADWIVEAVVERLDIKRALYQKLNEVIPADCIVTSNTSTIPISLLVETMPESFRRRFAITHYFNPVRYMRLLELVRGSDAAVMQKLADFNDRELGKGVVACNDTPGFLGNRVGVFALQAGIDEAQSLQLPIEYADALMGRPMGIPKTGVFGLYDLIGIDLMADVVRSLRSILPAGDAFHAVGAESDMINGMVNQGLTGNKGGGGFYRRDSDGKRLARDLETGEYRPAMAELPARALAAAEAIADQREPLVDLVAGSDVQAQFCQNVLGRVLGYAASLLGEVTDSAQDIDDAMKLGFNWIRGPFEMIDALGSDKVIELLSATGASIPASLRSDKPFYAVSENVLTVRHANGDMDPIALPDGVVRFHMQRRVNAPLYSNRAASVFAIENGYRLIEFHSKANALTDESMQMVAQAASDHGRGILVHNDAQHYSAGVDLNAFLTLIDAGDWQGIDEFLARFQNAVAALKYAPVPVVGAPSGLALGGGFEVLLHCDARVMHSNSVVGLVESGVGVLPAGGGVKETYWRWYQKTGNWEKAAWKAWMNLGYGAMASSPQLAQKLQYFDPEIDVSLMNRDRLYQRSVQMLDTLTTGYVAPEASQFQLAGGDILERMGTFMDEGVARGDFYPHDKTVAMQIASVMCSEDGQSVEVSEQDLYDRERAAFIRLAQTPETRARIYSLLHAGGAVRN